MLLTEEEYKEPINFRTKQISNSVLALKFHEIIHLTLQKILHTDDNNIISLLDGKTKVKMKSSEYGITKYPKTINMEFIKINTPTCWCEHLSKTNNEYFKLDYNKTLHNYIGDKPWRMSDWDSSYFRDFIKFTALQSKSFKKKLIKVVYIFENRKTDSKYRTVFNFLVNYLGINITQRINNFDTTTDKAIDDTKIRYYNNYYYFKDYERILQPKELRNQSINSILKS